MVHVAIVTAEVEAKLVSGRKRVETRLSHSRRPPFGRVRTGDRVYFKRSGGGIFGRAIVRRVREYDRLTPEGIDELRKRFGEQVQAPGEFWERRRLCRFGVLIWLERFSRNRLPVTALPRQYGTAWLTLPRIRTGGAGAGS